MSVTRDQIETLKGFFTNAIAIFDLALSTMPAIEPPTDTGTLTAINLAKDGFFAGNKPYINLLKSAARGYRDWVDWNDKFTNPRTQALINIPQTDNVSGPLSKIMQVNTMPEYTLLRAGTYYCICPGELQVTVDGIGVENGRWIAPGTWAFDVPATIDGKFANPTMNLHVLALKAGLNFASQIVDGIEYPVVMHSDDEADYMAGAMFQRDWLRSLSGAKVLRFMDWNEVNQAGYDDSGNDALPVIEPENFYTADCLTYVNDGDHKWFTPPEVCGRLCRDTGADAWVDMPIKYSDAAREYWVRMFALGAGPNWTGRIYATAGNELWNRAWPWQGQERSLLTHVVPNIAVVDRDGTPSTSSIDQVGCAGADLAIKAWRAWERVYALRVVRVLSGQFMAGTGNTGMGGMFAYVDPLTGCTAGSMAYQYAVAPYWGLDEMFTTASLIGMEAWTKPDDWWVHYSKLSIDNMQPALATNKAMLAQLAPNLRLTTYEAGGWVAPADAKNNWSVDQDKLMLLDRRCRAIMDGDAGAEITRYYWDTFINGNFALYNHFFSHGYTLGLQEGLCNSQFTQDTPRMALFRNWRK